MKQSKPLPFIFIHIPKTGGMSVRKFLKNKYNYKINTYSTKEKEQNLHDTLFQLESINNLNENTFIFSICRNPYRRIYSYYKYLIRENMISKSISFENYIKEIDSTKLSNLQQNHFIQGWWLISKNNYLNKKIYYFENLNEFEKDFQGKLNRENKTNFDTSLYIEEYTNETRKRVLDIYYDDFLIFDYSMDWENSF
jgi:hypothetical protein